MARKLSFDFKLTARTAPELYEAVNNVVTRAASEGVKFRRRKVGIEALVNALLIDFLDRDEDGRLALLRANIPRFEQLLELAPNALPPARPSQPWIPGSVRDQTAIDEQARPRERKRAGGDTEYGKGGRLGDEPKKGGRKGTG